MKIAALKEHDYTATMSARLILKDIDLMLALARTHEVPMPLTANTRQLMQVLVGEGRLHRQPAGIATLADHVGVDAHLAKRLSADVMTFQVQGYCCYDKGLNSISCRYPQ